MNGQPPPLWTRIAFALALLLPSPSQAFANRPVAPLARVDPLVSEQIASQGKSTFWAILRKKANLSPAFRIADWDSRGRFVYNRLQAVANSSQAGLRSLLNDRRAKHRPFWVVNAIQVTGDRQLLEELSARAEVAEIVADQAYSIPRPEPVPPEARLAALEWNLERIGAPQVWTTFGVRGEGIVIASIDSGVQFDHPALLAHYRGNQGGLLDHNYNWFDPAGVCGDPWQGPCDNIPHGTHVTGTMLGDDGNPGENQIGVAPGALWVAAKGCETHSCSFSSLLASAEWILAPTDLEGQNPRPDLRPHVVNNSWSSWPGDPFYRDMLQAWLASGIFPVFAVGNSGPGCGTAASPGDYPESYGVGAFDAGNGIADFSGRGPSAFEALTKPNVAAPGVGVRSSVPTDDYTAYSGTSMAAPHVSGAVALIWSAAPALQGEIAATRALIDSTAVDVEDLSCGGSPANNNVWGEGRLDAFAAVEQAPRGSTGALLGKVTSAASGLLLVGARLAAAGAFSRATLTDAAGFFRIVLPAGLYQVTASLFGYRDHTVDEVEIREGATFTLEIALEPLAQHPVSGYVRGGGGEAIPGARVTILGAPIPPAFSDERGFYAFASVPEGTYEVKAEAGRCYESQSLALAADGEEFLDFALPQRVDGFGYTCTLEPLHFIEAPEVLPLFGDDDSTKLELPFTFNFYGRGYGTVHIATNGFLNFWRPNADYNNVRIPDPAPPNAAIYPFWDDLFVDEAASVRTGLLGEAPNRQFVIEWRQVAFCCISEERVRFEVVLYENNEILVQYLSIDEDDREQGNSATIGLEDEQDSNAFLYSYNQAILRDGLAVRYRLPAQGFVAGKVSDAIDGLPIARAAVTALESGISTSTDAQGYYQLGLPAGTFTLEASAANYTTARAQAEILEGQTAALDFTLNSARAQANPTALEFALPEGEMGAATLTLQNLGLVELNFEIEETPVAATGAGGSLAAGAPIPDSRTPPPGYQPEEAAALAAEGQVLVFMDLPPWGSDALIENLVANGVPFELANSAEMGTIDLAAYSAIFLSNDQPERFYANYGDHLERLAEYVAGGGFLWVGAAAWGWNDGDFSGGQLPGGASVFGPLLEEYNDVMDAAHPLMQGLPNPFFGAYASHAVFQNLPQGTNVIARGRTSLLPTLIEYRYGVGKVLALAQPMEHAWMYGYDAGLILENGVPYAAAFEPVAEVPWLFEEPASGSIAPGETRAIRVSVDTAGLAPGLYRARLLIRTNDPRNTLLQVPATLVVAAYQQAVNAGDGAYAGPQGGAWAADRRYTPGSWGYLEKSNTFKTEAAIAGTEEDPLYQTARRGQVEYRFDGLPEGVYRLELRFAEIQNQRPGKRQFDVIAEGAVLLPAHDIAAEVGKNAADEHIFYVRVSDGQLNLRFVTRRSFKEPLVSAIRVTAWPER